MLNAFQGEVKMSKIASTDSAKLTPASSRRSSAFGGILRSPRWVRNQSTENNLPKETAQSQGRCNIPSTVQSTQMVISPGSVAAVIGDPVKSEQLAQRAHDDVQLQGGLKTGPAQHQVHSSLSDRLEEQGTTRADVSSLESCASDKLPAVVTAPPSSHQKPSALDPGATGIASTSVVSAWRRQVHEGLPQLLPAVQIKRKVLETVSEITPVEDDGDDEQQRRAAAAMHVSESGGAATGATGGPLLEALPALVQSSRIANYPATHLGNTTPAVGLVLDAEPSYSASQPHLNIKSAAAAAPAGRAAVDAPSAGGRVSSPLNSKGHSSTSGRSLGRGQNSDGQQEAKAKVYVRRLYQFAVEVWSAPSDTVFGRTKV
jgi:hypothetical protein